MRRIVIKLFSLLTCFILAATIFTPNLKVGATLQDDLVAVQQKLKEIRDQKNSIQNTINSEKKNQNQLNAEIANLKIQIDLLDNQIQEKELIIQELNLQILILNQNIETTTYEIAKAEKEISGLQVETDKRMVDMYISEKTFSQLDMFFTKEGADIIKYSAYQTSFQKETTDLVVQLNNRRNELSLKKDELEANKLQVVSNQTQLDQEKTTLTATQSQLAQQKDYFYKKRNESMNALQQSNQQLNIYTDEEKKALAQQTIIEQELFNNIQNLQNGAYVLKGTIIGQQGYSGYVIPKGPGGAHLHFSTKVNGNSVNPCSLLPAGTFGNCAGSGVIDWPLRGTFYYTSSYGWRSWSNSFHDAIDIASPTTHAYEYAAINGYMYRGGSYSGGYWRKICEDKNNCNRGIYLFYLHLKD